MVGTLVDRVALEGGPDTPAGYRDAQDPIMAAMLQDTPVLAAMQDFLDRYAAAHGPIDVTPGHEQGGPPALRNGHPSEE